MVQSTLSVSALLCVVISLAACCGNAPSRASNGGDGSASPVTWAIAIHGGAGTLDRSAPAAEKQEYLDALHGALRTGRDMLASGASSLDVCEAVVRILEDDPHFNAGRGAAFNEKGGHELDASIMDGATLRCGAVAGVRTIRNPISLARLVMERTRHVLLMGDGAEDFATATGVERVPNSYFDTDRRRRMLEEHLRERDGAGAAAMHPDQRYGTVGCVCRDSSGNLAAATSTGGLTGKKFGRVGDSPIIGAGTYATTECAVSGTGTGEEFIRHGVARAIASRMQYGGATLEEAARAVVFEILKPDDGGIIGVDARGELVTIYNSDGMYRGVADSTGRFDVRIFE